MQRNEEHELYTLFLSLSLSLFFSLKYYVTRGERPRYSHARYEMQRLAKRTRSKIRQDNRASKRNYFHGLSDRTDDFD